MSVFWGHYSIQLLNSAVSLLPYSACRYLMLYFLSVKLETTSRKLTTQNCAKIRPGRVFFLSKVYFLWLFSNCFLCSKDTSSWGQIKKSNQNHTETQRFWFFEILKSILCFQEKWSFSSREASPLTNGTFTLLFWNNPQKRLRATWIGFHFWTLLTLDFDGSNNYFYF